MTLKLLKHWTKQLLKYPEAGMGYQLVDVMLQSGEVIKRVVVLNATVLVLPDKYSEVRLTDIATLSVTEKEKV